LGNNLRITSPAWFFAYFAHFDTDSGRILRVCTPDKTNNRRVNPHGRKGASRMSFDARAPARFAWGFVPPAQVVLNWHTRLPYTRVVKVICAPDSYKESLSAVDAANAMADGIRLFAPHAIIDCCPVGDGGEGTLMALLSSAEGRICSVEVSDPFGEDIIAEYGLFLNGQRAFIESARCIGLQLVPATQRDPTKTTSFGVGELMLQAAEDGVKEIIVGLGGSATNDGGCGMAQALGYRFFNSDDKPITEPLTGGMLSDIARIDAKQRTEALHGISIVAAADVVSPLCGPNGAARTFGRQKGATDLQMQQLDEGMVHLAWLIRRDLGIDVETLAGAGAAGGLGGGLVAFAGARIESGISLVLDAIGFAERVTNSGLCLTGEGRLDGQSVSGKACIGVAKAAAAKGVPAIALVGSAGDGADQCLASGLHSYVVIGADLSPEESMRRTRELISSAATATFSKFS
jgi:glycerate kinase